MNKWIKLLLNRRLSLSDDGHTMVYYLLRKRLSEKHENNADKRPDTPETEDVTPD